FIFYSEKHMLTATVPLISISIIHKSNRLKYTTLKTFKFGRNIWNIICSISIAQCAIFQCLPTCLLCTCLGTTVYCDDHELDAVPPLPKKTTHFYSRYNRIKKINKNDFANQNNLKRIDLTSNFISEIDEDAFRELPQLQELVLRDNKIQQLPELPPTLTFIDVSDNRLGRKGIKEEAFKDMVDLHHLYITDNNLDHIPLPLPESLQALHLQNNNIQEMHEDTFCKMKDVAYARRALEDIRLDGNPINLSKTPSAYMCLPRLPIGSLI
uniref:LRRNT domain-containing protein n=1 Tax=Chelydra serpentina TaxID=8475 RepID=A0A8C3RL37_CHESE